MLGFGQDGPYKDRAGYDVIAASIGGLLHITGPEVSYSNHKPSYSLFSGFSIDVGA